MSKQSEKEGLMDCLFSRQDMRLVNLKFFRGSRDQLSDVELEKEAHAAVIQKQTGAAIGLKNAPRSKQPRVNVSAFVAKL